MIEALYVRDGGAENFYRLHWWPLVKGYYIVALTMTVLWIPPSISGFGRGLYEQACWFHLYGNFALVIGVFVLLSNGHRAHLQSMTDTIIAKFDW